MAIVIIRQDGKIKQWQDALKLAEPGIGVYNYLEPHPKEEIVMAVIWKHPHGILNEYPNLKCIASSGAGVDFIFEDSDLPAHLSITRVVDHRLASDMSEHVIAVIFSYLKNLGQYRLDQVNGAWRPREYRRISDLTIGILGMGALGTALAKDLVRYGFKGQGWANSEKNMADFKTFTGGGQLPDFLKTTDILVCLLPLTDATYGILDKALFKQLPQGAYIINVARGGHIVDTDLLEMIDAGHLSGACLDVFHQEPLPTDHPFWKHHKIHMTPHYASVSDTRSVVPQIIENYHRLQQEKPLLNLVSKERGY